MEGTCSPPCMMHDHIISSSQALGRPQAFERRRARDREPVEGGIRGIAWKLIALIRPISAVVKILQGISVLGRGDRKGAGRMHLNDGPLHVAERGSFRGYRCGAQRSPPVPLFLAKFSLKMFGLAEFM